MTFVSNNPTAHLLCIDLSTNERYIVDYSLEAVNYLPSWLFVTFTLFFLGLLGMVYNYRNFLVTMMCVEIMYLGTVTSFVAYGIAFHDTKAAIYGLLILIFAACESAVGLGLLVAVYGATRKLGFNTLALLGG
jgi:NADH:ubiquinone oxidoreductase subunit K